MNSFKECHKYCQISLKEFLIYTPINLYSLKCLSIICMHAHTYTHLFSLKSAPEKLKNIIEDFDKQ